MRAKLTALFMFFLTDMAYSQATAPSAVCAEKFMPGSTEYSRCLSETPEPQIPQNIDMSGLGAPEGKSVGRWRSGSATDRMDGTKSTWVRMETLKTMHAPHRRPVINNVTATLDAECRGKNFRVMLYVKDALLGGHRTQVAYRFDENPPIRGQWTASTDSTAVALWETKQATPFAKSMMKAKTLFIRVQHNVFGTFEADFNVEGFANAVEPVSGACGLKL